MYESVIGWAAALFSIQSIIQFYKSLFMAYLSVLGLCNIFMLLSPVFVIYSVKKRKFWGYRLAMSAAKELSSQGTKVSVVSMPNPGLFLQQEKSYRESVLPGAIRARVAVEAGVTAGWASFVGDAGRVVGVDRFGASAPAGVLFEQYGLTVEKVSQAVRDSLAAIS